MTLSKQESFLKNPVQEQNLYANLYVRNFIIIQIKQAY